jgi:hypothetical protein
LIVFVSLLGLLGACGDDGDSAGSDTEDPADTDASTTGMEQAPAIMCNPLDQGCGSARSCLPTGTGFACQAYNVDVAGTLGDECGSPAECSPGLYCHTGALASGCSGPGCCASWCDLSLTDPCVGLEMCQPWFSGDIPLDGEDIGICGVAP